MRVMIRPSITVQAITLVTFLGIIACQEPPLVPALNPVDQGISRDQSLFIPEAFDAMVETDAMPPALFGEPCDQSRECESGYCIDTPNMGRLCTERCAGDCPDGFECTPTSVGGDDILLCAVDGNDLCRSCEEDSDCDDAEDLCIRIGQLTYCGEDCSDSGDCPEGFDVIPSREGEILITNFSVSNSGECAPCLDDDEDGYGMGDDCLGFDCEMVILSVMRAPELRRDNDCDSLIDEELANDPPEERGV